MTEETRQNTIRHIRTALDIDEWAKEAAIEALEVYRVKEEQVRACVDAAGQERIKR